MSTWQKLGTCVSLFVSVTVSVTCLCWSLAHAEQLLFSCLCSKVSICDYVTCHILHVTCHIAHVTCHMSNAYVDSWDMLNNFCFEVFAQKWVFVIMSHVTCCMSHVACHMSHVLCQMLKLILGTCWPIFVFMSMLKCRCLWMKTSMLFFTDFLTDFWPSPVSEPIIELVPS